MIKIKLTNKHNMQVLISDFGARILSIKVPSSSGELVETTLNYESEEDIINDESYMGATCGRVCNRISNAQYYEGENLHTLVANEGNNTLHGGAKGFSDQYWLCEQPITGEQYQEITLTLVSLDQDQGFAGNLEATVTYRLSNTNCLSIFYRAKSDKKSPINLCNHSYFTLGETNINDLTLKVNAARYLPINESSIPTGEISMLCEDMDFRTSVKLSEKLAKRDFDDCYVLSKNASNNLGMPACILSSHKHQIDLEIYTDHIALQVYTGNYLPIKHSAIALEAQGLIDAVNQAGFEDDWVGPHQHYTKEVHYQFKL